MGCITKETLMSLIYKASNESQTVSCYSKKLIVNLLTYFGTSLNVIYTHIA